MLAKLIPELTARADCENGLDEIKNQWGWGGYTTHDIERCALSARAVALIYNWWSWYVRLAHPKTRLEAITSRPMLLAAVGRMTRHSRLTKLVLASSPTSVPAWTIFGQPRRSWTKPSDGRSCCDTSWSKCSPARDHEERRRPSCRRAN